MGEGCGAAGLSAATKRSLAGVFVRTRLFTASAGMA
jgi:hypothetical protein